MTTLSTGKATSFIDFTRASNATVTDSDGKVKWAPHNLLTNSESFDAASWTQTGTTISANTVATTAPNGTNTADKWQETAGGSGHALRANVSVVSGVTYRFAIYAKAAENSYVGLFGFKGTVGKLFNLSNGTVGNNISAAPASAGIEAVGNGWYRCWIEDTETATVGRNLDIYSSKNGTTWDYSGTLNDGVYLWGAHLYRSDLAMQPNTSAYPMYNPTTPKNLLGYTEDFVAGPWVKVDATISANSVIAHNGLQTADKLVETATTATHLAVQVITGNTGGSTFSIYAKAAERTILGVGFSSPVDSGVYIDLTNGSLASNLGSAPTSYSVTPVGNGWYRLSVTNTGANVNNPWVLLSNGSPSTARDSYTGDGTSGIYVWGAQLSDSASLDSYVPVYGAAVTSAAYYGPRRDFDPVTLACKGLLVEEQRANLVLNSNAFDNAAWTVTGTTIASSAVTAPDGTISADDWKIDNGIAITTSALGLYTSGITARLATSATISLSAIPYTCSLYVKLGSGISHIQLRVGTALDLTGTSYGVIVKLSDGTVSNGTAAVTPAGNGWFRIAFTFTPTAASHYVGVWAWNDTSKTANGTEFVSFYGAQLEAGSFATSYIPTGAATATRNADVASVSTQAFPYSATEGTLVANVVPTLTIQNNTRALWFSNASDRVVDMYIDAGNWQVYNGSATISPGTPAASVGVQAKFAAAYKSGSYASVLNGGAAGTAASTLVNTATNMYLGCGSSGTLQLNGHIRQITYLPRRLTNTELQTRTA